MADKLADNIGELANPMWNNEGKKQALAEIAKKEKLCKTMTNFLQTVAENGRAGLLVEILREYENYFYKQRHITVATVKTVIDLSATQKAKLTKALEKYVGGEVIINCVICPEILGGLAVEIGSEMIDDSISGKLKRLELLMKGTV